MPVAAMSDKNVRRPTAARWTPSSLERKNRRHEARHHAAHREERGDVREPSDDEARELAERGARVEDGAAVFVKTRADRRDGERDGKKREARDADDGDARPSRREPRDLVRREENPDADDSVDAEREQRGGAERA